MRESLNWVNLVKRGSLFVTDKFKYSERMFNKNMSASFVHRNEAKK